MRRGLNFIFILFILFLIGIVSAETNYALNGTPSHANQQAGENNYLVWTWNDVKLNDNSITDTAHGVVVSNRARYSTWASFESIITFPTPIAQLDQIQAYAGIYQNDVMQLRAYVDTGAGWQQVGDTGVIRPSPGWFSFTNGAPWYNVVRIKVYSYSLCAPWSYVDYKLFEIRAWGPDPTIPCTPETDVAFCTRLGVECGITTNNDNCGNPRTVNCGECYDINPCSSPDDIILKLYSSNNSHGALWNDIDYKYDICYSDIFGSYYTGASPHLCSGTANKVLGLSDTTNAHAEVPSLSNYLVNVCYGNLVCRGVTEPTACASDERIVVKLSEQTNAHLSDVEGSYPVKICCKSGGPSKEYSAYWTNMMDEQITSANLGDLVKLAVAGSGISGEIEYNVIKDIPWWFDRKVAQTSSYGYTTWRAGIDNENTGLPGDYYFIAKLTDGTEVRSGTLGVLSSLVNSPPRVRIISPEVDFKFRVGNSISFIAEFEDEDDDLKATWYFGDGESVTKFNCLTGTNCNVNYSYNSQGAFVVTVVAEEIGRTGKATNETRVLIYDENLNLFSIIDKPEFGRRFSGQSFIDFDAKRSYVSFCTSSGSCNFPTTPAGGSSITDCYDVRGLKCFDYPKDWIDKDGGYELYFNWTFSEGAGRIGNWAEDYSRVVEFNRLFIMPNEEGHWAKLKIGYEAL